MKTNAYTHLLAVPSAQPPTTLTSLTEWLPLQISAALVLTRSWRTLAVVTFETSICLTSQMVKVRGAQYFEKKKKCHNRVFFKKHLALQRKISKEKSPISDISNMLVWYSMNERGISLLIIHVCVYVWKCALAALSGCFLCMWAVWLSTKINFLWEAPATGQNHSIAPLFSCV